MATLRQYLTTAQASQITGAGYNESVIAQAEVLVDNLINEFSSGVFQKSYNLEYFETDRVTFSGNTCTISGGGYKDGEMRFTVIRILEGDNAGLELPVMSNIANVLTFSEGSINGNFAVEIYQLGKFPMIAHVRDFSRKRLKFIPREVQEAVAWQTEFIYNNPDIFDSFAGGVQSENIGSSYSYQLGDGQTSANFNRFYSAKTKLLLKPYLARCL